MEKFSLYVYIYITEKNLTINAEIPSSMQFWPMVKLWPKWWLFENDFSEKTVTIDEYVKIKLPDYCRTYCLNSSYQLEDKPLIVIIYFLQIEIWRRRNSHRTKHLLNKIGRMWKANHTALKFVVAAALSSLR